MTTALVLDDYNVAALQRLGVRAVTPLSLVAALDVVPAADPDQPHEFDGPGPESDLFDGECGRCGRTADHPLHFVVEVVGDGPFGASPIDVETPPVPHEYAPMAGADDDPEGEGDALPPPLCECGLPHDDPVHVTVASGEFANNAADVVPGQRFRIPLVVPEGVTSGDGRTFAENSLSSRETPLALMWQVETDDGHKRSVIVGRIDHVERLTEGGLGNAYGVFDTGEDAQEALRLIRGGMLRGISADLDEFDADVLGGGEDENKVTSTKLRVTSGRLMGITLVAKPAYPECVIELVDGEDEAVPDGEYEEQTPDAVAAALVASAAPVTPPKAWFQNPSLDQVTPITVTDAGQVFGHIASWSMRHIGLPYGTRPPKSASNYAYFRTGVLRTAEGDDVPVGQLTLAGGHAPLEASASAAVKHYDDTASAWADVAAGEDKHGIWVAGALRPDVSAAQVRVARASSPSGDWRPINGTLELVAACCVNVPGFPIARAMVASGVVTALVAAGCFAPERSFVDELSTHDVDQRLAALEAAEQRRLEAAALVARGRVAPVFTARREALTAAASIARERVESVRVAKRDALESAKLTLTARVAAGGALHVAPNFDEDKHPRDGTGRFREVLGRLHELFGGSDGRSGPPPGVGRLQDAVDKSEAGDVDGAAVAAEDGAKELTDAAEKATGDEKARLTEAADQVRSAVEEAKSGVTDADGNALVETAEVLIDELSDEAKELLLEAVDRAEQHLDPADPDALLGKVKAFLTGTNPMSVADVVRFIENQLERSLEPGVVRSITR